MKKFVEVWIDAKNQYEFIEKKCFKQIEELIQEIEISGNEFIQLIIFPTNDPKTLRGGYFPRVFLIFETIDKNFKTYYDIRKEI
jgi:hypothetical protein